MNAPILIVDDNADLLKIVQLILQSKGYESMTATTIEDATHLIQTYSPSLVLLDASICKEGDGRQFCDTLKHNLQTGDIRVILMSGNDYGKEEWNGADDFLSKPFDFTDMLQKVEMQLSASDAFASSTA